MAAFVKVYIDKLKVRFNAQCIRKIEIVWNVPYRLKSFKECKTMSSKYLMHVCMSLVINTQVNL